VDETPVNNLSEVYSIAEVARFTGLHHMTIRNYVKAGRLPAELIDGKFGPTYVISKAALVADPELRKRLSPRGEEHKQRDLLEAAREPGYIELLDRYRDTLEELAGYKVSALMLEAAEKDREDLHAQVEEKERQLAEEGRRLEELREQLHAQALEAERLKGLTWRGFRKWRRADR
jgi:hypothetical protein